MSAGDSFSVLLLDAGAGTFRVRLSLTARRNAAPADAWVFLGRRMLAAAIPDFKGACEVSGLVRVDAPSSERADVLSGRLAVTLFAPSLLLSDCRVTETDVPALYIANPAVLWAASASLSPSALPSEWGQALSYFLSEKLAVVCRTYEEILLEATEADYVLLPTDRADAAPEDDAGKMSFRETLSRRVGEIRARGARPLLATPVAGGERDEDVLKARATATVAVGERSRVPVLDLHARTAAKREQQGEEALSALWLPGAPARMNLRGAYFAARIAASELRRVCGWEEGYQSLAETVEKGALTEGDPAAAMFARERSVF